MELKKLSIHNIASIADAEIDFKGESLSGASIFLICGETGAGKSTILDAICLALFEKHQECRLSAERKLRVMMKMKINFLPTTTPSC